MCDNDTLRIGGVDHLGNVRMSRVFASWFREVPLLQRGQLCRRSRGLHFRFGLQNIEQSRRYACGRRENGRFARLER